VRALGLASKCKLGERRAHPPHIVRQRPPACSFIGGGAEPERQIGDRAGGVVEPDAAAIDGLAGRGLIHGERRLQHVLAPDIEDKIAEVVVPVGPGGTVAIKDVADRVGLRIER